MLLQFQEVEVKNGYKDALLLLALYREVTCSQPQSVSDEVSRLLILQADISGSSSGEKFKTNTSFDSIRSCVIS